METSKQETLNKPSDMSHKISDMASKTARSTADYLKTSNAYVKENPGKSLALAVAAGAFAGSILTIASKRRH